MKPPSFASNSRLSAELMEAISTAAAVTAPAATTEGAAGGWWSATAAAAAASAASLAVPAATTVAWHAARARILCGIQNVELNVISRYRALVDFHTARSSRDRAAGKRPQLSPRP